MLDIIRGIFFIIILLLVCLAALLGLATGVAYPFAKYECDQQIAALHNDGYFNFFAGCFVKTEDGRYVEISRWRGFEEMKLQKGK